MSRIVFASCLLAIVAAAPADEKKTFPGWPTSFSGTFLVTEPFNTPGGAKGEQVSKVWYDGEAGNLKRELKAHTVYVLRNYNGRGGAVVEENSEAGSCGFKYEANADIVKQRTKNPFPSAEKAEFIDDNDANGVKVEQWQISITVPVKGIVKAYIRQQDGVAIPVRFELYNDVPPTGSDMILPTVVEVKEFSTSKPDASVFEFDTSKCKEAVAKQ